MRADITDPTALAAYDKLIMNFYEPMCANYTWYRAGNVNDTSLDTWNGTFGAPDQDTQMIMYMRYFHSDLAKNFGANQSIFRTPTGNINYNLTYAEVASRLPPEQLAILDKGMADLNNPSSYVYINMLRPNYYHEKWVDNLPRRTPDGEEETTSEADAEAETVEITEADIREYAALMREWIPENDDGSPPTWEQIVTGNAIFIEELETWRNLIGEQAEGLPADFEQAAIKGATELADGAGEEWSNELREPLDVIRALIAGNDQEALSEMFNRFAEATDDEDLQQKLRSLPETLTRFSPEELEKILTINENWDQVETLTKAAEPESPLKQAFSKADSEATETSEETTAPVKGAEPPAPTETP